MRTFASATTTETSMPTTHGGEAVAALWPTPVAMLGRLAAELERLLAVLDRRDDIAEVWLFGSLLAGDVHTTSDIDLLVVQRTTLGPVERALALRVELASPESLDLFVFTPDEMTAGRRFPAHICAHGRRLR